MKFERQITAPSEALRSRRVRPMKGQRVAFAIASRPSSPPEAGEERGMSLWFTPPPTMTSRSAARRIFGALLPLGRSPRSCAVSRHRSAKVRDRRAQRLFGQQPGQPPRLKACSQLALPPARQTTASTCLGVMARDAGDREHAIAYLRKAHEIAPRSQIRRLSLASPWRRSTRVRHARSTSRYWRAIRASRPAALRAGAGRPQPEPPRRGASTSTSACWPSTPRIPKR